MGGCFEQRKKDKSNGHIQKKNKSENENFGSILRLVEGRISKDAEGKYKRGCLVKDDSTGEVLIESDVYERDIYSELKITDNKKQIWKIKPNRKIMPLRWHVYSPDNKKASEIRLPGFLRMMNPFSRRRLRITDFPTNRRLLFIDLESGFLDFIFHGSPLFWSITENKKVIAKISYLAKKDEEFEEQETSKKKGFFSRMKKWFKGSDWSLQSYGPEPVINAQTFLALSLIHKTVHKMHPE